MKTMTVLENIIMSRTVCDRATANLIANDILAIAERDFGADVRHEAAKEIFEEIDSILSVKSDGVATLDVREFHSIEKKYTAGETRDVLDLRKGFPVWYVHVDTGEIETGRIFSASFSEDGKLDSISIDFDCGDFDEFNGNVMGVSVFTSKAKAEQAACKARLGK